ncbi:MAG: hypothetical protein NWF00_10885 [Candidatus Bathyarchaeota archaeon]|nr:hypothetical protein [Candidatus Bathyarchaeota archaeon]
MEKRTPEQEKAAENALKTPKAFSDLLEGMQSKNRTVRYDCFKTVYLISEDKPEALYPKWSLFEDMLKSGNSMVSFYAIHILANLSRIDAEHKFEKLFDAFYVFLNGDELIPASHVAYVSHKIVEAKPELTDRVTEKLLTLEGATYKHRELVQANALKSISAYFDKVSDKDKVINLAEELQKKGGKAKKEAVEFMKKWKIT